MTMTQTTSRPDPYENVRATVARLRGRAPDEFNWFLRALEELKMAYFEQCATVEAGAVLNAQGHAQCVAKLLFELQKDA